MNLVEQVSWDLLSKQTHVLIDFIILPFLIVRGCLELEYEAQEAKLVSVNSVKPDVLYEPLFSDASISPCL
jgi:hypothetical protein